jgi:hypothetical protein
MRSYHIPDSILPRRLHFSREDIEKIARDELRQVECLPKSPEPVDLEKYLTRRHGIEPRQTERLAPGALGAADLRIPGKPVIWIRQDVFNGHPHRYRSTLAHEIAHLQLHAQLYLDAEFSVIVERCHRGEASLARGFECGEAEIREAPRRPSSTAHPLFHLEYQANLGMVALATPVPLVKACVEAWTRIETQRGGGRLLVLDETRRDEAVSLVSETFEVSRELAGYRLADLFPPASTAATLSTTAHDRPAHSAHGNSGVPSWKTQKTLW